MRSSSIDRTIQTNDQISYRSVSSPTPSRENLGRGIDETINNTPPGLQSDNLPFCMDCFHMLPMEDFPNQSSLIELHRHLWDTDACQFRRDSDSSQPLLPRSMSYVVRLTAQRVRIGCPIVMVWIIDESI